MFFWACPLALRAIGSPPYALAKRSVPRALPLRGTLRSAHASVFCPLGVNAYVRMANFKPTAHCITCERTRL